MAIDFDALCGALGVDPEQAAGPVRETGTAPADQPETQEPEAQGPEAQGPEAQEPEAQGPEAQEPETQEPEGTTQSREERARFAALRRKAEMNAAVARARQEGRQQAEEAARRTIDEAFRASGMMNPYTQKPITTREEFDAYRTRYKEERRRAFLEKSGVSEAEFQTFLQEQGLTAAPQEQPPAQNPPAQSRQEEQPAPSAQRITEEQVQQELAEIHRLDPSVSTLEDILAGEGRDAFVAAVNRGNSFLDAFRLANFDRLQAQRQAEAAQRAAQAQRTKARSKDHLLPDSIRGTGAVAVPAETMEMYRLLMPNATDAEISADYNKILKQLKK